MTELTKVTIVQNPIDIKLGSVVKFILAIAALRRSGERLEIWKPFSQNGRITVCNA